MVPQGFRFLALDGLRGVAAIAVLLLHVPPLDRIVSHGYLAVDLFFMMSGFVVAFAYEHRLTSGWSVAGFMRARIVRLWPLYLLGTAIGAVVFATAVDDYAMGAALTLMVAAGALLIPLPLGADVQIFNLNRPAWSLFFEMVANLLYGAFVSKLGLKSLGTLSAIGAVAIAASFTSAGTGSLGHHGDSMLGGAARILFAFPLGVLFHRLYRAGRLNFSIPTPLIMTGFVATLALPDFGALNGVADAAVVILIFPALIASAITARVSDRFAGSFAYLALLSYPLYILHGPILMAFAQAGGESMGVLLAGAVTSVVVAGFAARWFDEPARALLARLLTRRTRRAGAPQYP